MSNKIFHASILNLSVITDILVDTDGNVYTWSKSNVVEETISLFHTPSTGGAYLAAEFSDIYSQNVPINKPYSVVALPIDGKVKEFVAMSLANVVTDPKQPKSTLVGFRPVNWDCLVHYGLYVSRMHDSIYSRVKRTLKSKLKRIELANFGDVIFIGDSGEYTVYNMARGNVYNVSATRALANPYCTDDNKAIYRGSLVGSYCYLPRTRYTFMGRDPLQFDEVFRCGKFNNVRVLLDNGTSLAARINFNFNTNLFQVEVIDIVANILKNTNNTDLVDDIDSKRRGDVMVVALHSIYPIS